jgi:hypothetical protein
MNEFQRALYNYIDESGEEFVGFMPARKQRVDRSINAAAELPHANCKVLSLEERIRGELDKC